MSPDDSRRPAFIVVNGKMVTLTPSQMQHRRGMTGYQISQYGEVRVYDGDCWKSINDIDEYDEYVKKNQKLIDLLKIPKEQIDMGDFNDEEEESEPEWTRTMIPVFLPNGAQGKIHIWQCPICAAGITSDLAKERHEHYHKTVACDWF